MCPMLVQMFYHFYYVQTLQAEFTQQENLLRELEIDASNFHEQKKLEAAERLEQQIALLKVIFANLFFSSWISVNSETEVQCNLKA